MRFQVSPYRSVDRCRSKEQSVHAAIPCLDVLRSFLNMKGMAQPPAAANPYHSKDPTWIGQFGISEGP